MKALTALRRDQRGYTLAELLITVAILGLIMAAVLAVQMTSNTMFLRGENQAEAQQDARAAMLMEEDLRMVGYGCPDAGCVTNAAPTDSTQAGLNYVKITSASTGSIQFFADTLNVSTSLTAAVNVNATNLPVASTQGFAVGNRIYISNGGTWDTRTITVVGVSNLTVSGLANAYPQGALVGRPRQITYQLGGTTLSRDAGDGNGLQALTGGVTSLTFTYRDTNDAVINENPISAGNLPNIRRIQIQTTTQSAAASMGFSNFTINTNVRPRNL